MANWHHLRFLFRGMLMLIGYVRVSTNDQNTELQRNALECAGCELIFEGKISGTKSDRPGLKKLLRTGALRHTAMITMGPSILLAVLPGLIRRMRDTGHIRDLHHHMAGAKPVHEILHLTIS